MNLFRILIVACVAPWLVILLSWGAMAAIVAGFAMWGGFMLGCYVTSRDIDGT